MKSTSDLPHEIFSASSNVASSFDWVIPKAFLSSSSDAIWIQNKTKSEHKKNMHWKKKQQKDDQNRAKYL